MEYTLFRFFVLGVSSTPGDGGGLGGLGDSDLNMFMLRCAVLAFVLFETFQVLRLLFELN
jgi:hypothetical protein